MPGILDFLRDAQSQKDVKRGLLDAVNRGVIGGIVGGGVDTMTGLVNAGGMAGSASLNKLGLLGADKMFTPIQRPIGGSEWLGDKMQSAGMVSENRNPVAEALAGVALPWAALRGAPALFNAEQAAIRNAQAPRAFNGPMANQAGALKISESDTSYRGSHTAPMKDRGNAPLHDLTQTYPEDIYSTKAAKYYGNYGGDSADVRAIALMQEAKGNPNMPVKMYRAVPYEKSSQDQLKQLETQMSDYMKRGHSPKDSALSGSEWYENAYRMRDNLKQKITSQDSQTRLGINDGDWVTLDKSYAKEHGEGALNGKYKIVSKTVPARKLFTDGNSIQEFGYDESGKSTLGLLGLLGAGVGGSAYGLRDK